MRRYEGYSRLFILICGCTGLFIPTNIWRIIYRSCIRGNKSSGLVAPIAEFNSPDLEALSAGDAKGKGEIQVHLRCLRVESTKPINEWKQSWPFPATAKINEHNVELDQAQRFTNGKLAGVDKATLSTRRNQKRYGQIDDRPRAG